MSDPDLARLDGFRRSPSRLGGPGDHKEWQHFLVFAGDLHVLINWNLIDDVWAGPGTPREVARLIAMVSRGAWIGGVDRFAADQVDAVPGRVDTRFGPNTLRFDGTSYHLHVELADRPIRAELVLTPRTMPAWTNNQPLSRDRAISWLFVPRLSASGWIELDGERRELVDAPAYHDHNWGHFRWGDDFAWEWGSVLPDDPASPWSIVYMRMADRARTVARCQGLYLWRGATHRRIFRDAEVVVQLRGRFTEPPSLRLPRVMALLAPGHDHDLPGRLTARAAGGGDDVRLEFTPEASSQVLLPSEVDPFGVVALHEVSGRASLRGVVGDEAIDVQGRAVFEFIRELR